MAEALRILIPKIRPDLDERFQVHAFDGIHDMLGKLPDRLRGYVGWIPADWRIIVVRDEDRKDCMELKEQVEEIARSAGLLPKTQRGRKAHFHVLTRIAVEELEAWLLGDIPAVVRTYQRVPATLGSKQAFRDPDAINGGTWEAMERVLQRAGHFLGGLPKIQVAREVAANMDPNLNTSKSFQAFRDGLRSL